VTEQSSAAAERSAHVHRGETKAEGASLIHEEGGVAQLEVVRRLREEVTLLRAEREGLVQRYGSLCEKFRRLKAEINAAYSARGDQGEVLDILRAAGAQDVPTEGTTNG